MPSSLALPNLLEMKKKEEEEKGRPMAHPKVSMERTAALAMDPSKMCVVFV